MTEIWDPKERGRIVQIAAVVPYIGPSLGPFIALPICLSKSWRWIFWIIDIATALFVLPLAFLYPNAHQPKIFSLKRLLSRKSDAEDTKDPTQSRADRQELYMECLQASVRPIWLFFTQPIVPLIGLCTAVLSGLNYMFIGFLPTVWLHSYRASRTESDEHLASFAVGSVIAALIGGHLADKWHRKAKEQNPSQPVPPPENRVRILALFGLFTPLGLLCFGWAVEKQAHWILPDLGIAIICAGITGCQQAMNMYMMDTYEKTLMPAMASSQFLKSCLAFAFPFWVRELYDRLGPGIRNTVLAIGALVIHALLLPYVLLEYGPTLRQVGHPKGMGEEHSHSGVLLIPLPM
jgi:MFS family permease